jgi:hypothetical protein
MSLMLFPGLALRPFWGLLQRPGLGPRNGPGACSPYKIDLTINLFRWTFADG